MIDHAYRVPIPSVGLNARLVISEREHPKEAQPDLADLYVHVKAPPTGSPSDDDLIARFEECVGIFARKKKLGLLYERPARLKISRLNVYMRHEHGDPFTLDLMIALFEALIDHLDRTRDPGDRADDATGSVDDSEDPSEFSEEENSEAQNAKDPSGSGKLPPRAPVVPAATVAATAVLAPTAAPAPTTLRTPRGSPGEGIPGSDSASTEDEE